MEELIIEPGTIEKNYWKDLWRYRELFIILSWRDVKVRYKQTVIGAAWSIIRPLLTTIIFTIVFNKVAKLESANAAPYGLMVFAGMLPWQFFANSLSEASNSLVGNANLVSKVYFPRMIVPASSIITSFVDFGISFLILIGMLIYYSYLPSIAFLLLPLFIVFAFIASFGVGLYVTALNVKYRDFRYIIPFVVQFGLYVTPVGYNSAVIPEKWKLLYYLNPMVGVIDGFRFCILNEKIYWNGFLISTAVSLVLLMLGVWYFRKTEKSFADNI
jgi:lipopolysaccharide transport system permease protein